MQLTVLGKSPAWSDAGGACSGYLVESEGRAILLDCGNGVFGKLRQRRDYRQVEAVVVSHLHGDHLLDLVPFSYALTLGPGSEAGAAKPRLIAPEGAAAFFRRLTGTWGDGRLLADAFAIEEYGRDERLEAGGVGVRVHPVRHFGPTHAVELISPGGGRIVFGADGRLSDELIAAAAGAEVLIVEATLPEPDPAPIEQRVHMSAAEAGEVGRRAGVGHLVLTHISDELDHERSLLRARAEFGGEVEIAREGLVVEVA